MKDPDAPDPDVGPVLQAHVRHTAPRFSELALLAPEDRPQAKLTAAAQHLAQEMRPLLRELALTALLEDDSAAEALQGLTSEPSAQLLGLMESLVPLLQAGGFPEVASELKASLVVLGQRVAPETTSVALHTVPVQAEELVQAYKTRVKQHAEKRRLAEVAESEEENRVQAARLAAEEADDQAQPGGPNPLAQLYTPGTEGGSPYTVRYDFTRSKPARFVGSRGDINYGPMLPPPNDRYGNALHVHPGAMLFLPLPKIQEGPSAESLPLLDVRLGNGAKQAMQTLLATLVPDHEDVFTIGVKDLKGTHFTYNVTLSTTIGQLKELIAAGGHGQAHAIANSDGFLTPSVMRLIANGVQMADEDQIRSHDLNSSSMVYLVLKLGEAEYGSSMYVIPARDVGVPNQGSSSVIVTSATSTLVAALVRSGTLGAAKAYQIYLEAAKLILKDAKQRIRMQNPEHDSLHITHLTQLEVKESLAGLRDAFACLEAYTTSEACREPAQPNYSECSAMGEQAPCAPLVLGQGLEAAVDAMCEDEAWQPRYGEIGAEWQASKGNGGGQNLNQYTITMQVMCNRIDALAPLAVLSTSLWCEKYACVSVSQSSGGLTMHGDFDNRDVPLEKNKWCTMSISVDLAAGELFLKVDQQGSHQTQYTAAKFAALGEIDGDLSIPLQDEARVCLFGDKRKAACGGWLIRNFRLEARAIGPGELQRLHDALTAEIEKSWAIARPEEVSNGFNKEKKALMVALNVSEETANELLQKHGGSASAVMMLESGNLGWRSFSDNDDDIYPHT